MDGLILLDRAQKAGLAVRLDGEKLIIRGPRRAEPVARLLIEHKPAVLAALTPWGASNGDISGGSRLPTLWRDRYAARVVHWFLHGQRRWQEAERLAFNELILGWHRQYGTRPDPSRCAGCGDGLPSDGGLIVDSDGARVHFDGVRQVACIIAYGENWRGAAVAGLHRLGIEAPVDADAL
jgi:hypothetical protein